MKNIFASFFVFILAFLTSCTAQKEVAEIKPLEKSLLWEVSGNGLTQPSYLFGTYHMMCEEHFLIKDKVKNAMAKTDKTILEVDFSDAAQMAEMQKYMMADKRISEQFNAEDLEKLETGLTKFGYRLEDIDQLSMMALYSMLTMKFFDCPPTEMKMIDLEIMQMSMAAGKKIGGLETMAEQAEIFADYLTPKELLKMVETFEKGKADTAEMLADYRSENLEEIGKAMHNEENMSAEQQKVLLDNRNLNWEKLIPQIMNTQPTFFAVGAGHLPGEFGMINLLRKKGYKVTPVLN